MSYSFANRVNKAIGRFAVSILAIGCGTVFAPTLQAQQGAFYCSDSKPNSTQKPGFSGGLPDAAGDEILGTELADLDEQFAALGGATTAFAPTMMGDFFGGGLVGVETVSGVANVPIAGGDRRFKVSENVSPVPQDRLFFNFNHFRNSITDVDGNLRSLDRFVFGLEKTFNCGNSSIEFRIPFASGLNSVQSFGSGELTNTEFGNVSLALKTILWRNECTMLTGGLTLNFPTGDDAEIVSSRTIISNDSVHIGPFLGLYYRPNERLFVQSFVQIDIDPSGNDVIDTDDGSVIGIMNDQTLLFLDLSIGYWLHRNDYNCGVLTGIAGLFEVHYTSTVNDTDTVILPFGDVLTNPFNRVDIVDLTAGLLFEFHNRSTLTVGVSAPVSSGAGNRSYDAEVQVFFNRYF